MKNGETKLTVVLRKQLEAANVHCIKLSDRFTRGVPDLMVVSDRVVLVELKVDEGIGASPVAEYARLGMSGAQDHHVRQICRRAKRGACCITGFPDGSLLRLWVPITPESELEKKYRLAAEQDSQVYSWLLGGRLF